MISNKIKNFMLQKKNFMLLIEYRKYHNIPPKYFLLLIVIQVSSSGWKA